MQFTTVSIVALAALVSAQAPAAPAYGDASPSTTADAVEANPTTASACTPKSQVWGGITYTSGVAPSVTAAAVSYSQPSTFISATSASTADAVTAPAPAPASSGFVAGAAAGGANGSAVATLSGTYAPAKTAVSPATNAAAGRRTGIKLESVGMAVLLGGAAVFAALI